MLLQNKREKKIIEWLFKNFKDVKNLKKGIEDDAAIFDEFVISVDTYVEKVHFDTSYLSLREIGRRITLGALSDICAMGANPLFVLLSVAVSPSMEWKELKNFFKGVEDISRKYKIDIAGGDTVSSSETVFTVVSVGKGEKVLRRNGAKNRDYLYITGYPGFSEAGRLLLKNRTKGFEILKKRHTYPELRFSLIKRIKKYINAAIDTSDGISKDAYSLAKASNVKIIIEKERIPIHPELEKACSILKVDPYFFAIHGGEDYEILFTSNKKLPEVINNVLVTKIGYVKKGRGVFIKEKGKTKRLKIMGYEHFS